MKIIYIKNKYLYMVIMALILFIFIIYTLLPKVALTYLPITNKIVGIDPGHGGIDPGAVGKNGISENEINLSIGLKLKRYIEQGGGFVVITRADSGGLYSNQSTTIKEKKKEDLMKRKEIIEDGNCDIFLSIHLNSFQQSQYHGAQTFYKIDSEESMKLAYIVQEELRNVLDENNNRIPQNRDDLYLLRELDIPSILVECGFLSNPQEEALLANERYQDKIAWAIYKGITRYFNEE